MTTQGLEAVHLNEEPEDPYALLRRLSPRVTGSLLRLRESAYSDGSVPRRIKVLVALSISAAIRCQPCIDSYASKAVEEDATEAEVVEVLNVAMAMQGCAGEAWALKAFEAYRAAKAGRTASFEAGADCCAP